MGKECIRSMSEQEKALVMNARWELIKAIDLIISGEPPDNTIIESCMENVLDATRTVLDRYDEIRFLTIKARLAEVEASEMRLAEACGLLLSLFESRRNLVVESPVLRDSIEIAKAACSNRPHR